MKLLNTKDLDQFNIEGGYHKGGECDYTQLYPDAVERIARARQVDEKDITLLDCWHAGEICVYISGKWSGYVSEYEKEDVYQLLSIKRRYLMFNLQFKDSKYDGWPQHESKICYYVLNDTPYLTQSLSQQFSDITYEWYSDCSEVHEYYDPSTQGHYSIGDRKPSEYFSDDENESHRTVRLQTMFHGSGYTSSTPDDENFPRIAWAYTHDIQRFISQKMEGVLYFPCFDIMNLLRQGVVTVKDYNQFCVEEGVCQNTGKSWKHHHIHATVGYEEKLFHLILVQEGNFENDVWMQEDGTFGDVSVLRFERLNSDETRRS